MSAKSTHASYLLTPITVELMEAPLQSMLTSFNDGRDRHDNFHHSKQLQNVKGSEKNQRSSNIEAIVLIVWE